MYLQHLSTISQNGNTCFTIDFLLLSSNGFLLCLLFPSLESFGAIGILGFHVQF